MGILQGKARGGEEESILMHDLKPFRILISLLDKPELGNQPRYVLKTILCAVIEVCFHRTCVAPSLKSIITMCVCVLKVQRS